MDKEKCKQIIEDLKTSGMCLELTGGFIVPISHDYQVSLPDCVDLLSKWRIENPSLSPTQFPVSNERTERWLKKMILENEFRVMFMIQNAERRNIGHIGLSEFRFDTSTVRIDSVMKGVKNECPGIMAMVIEVLKKWCKDQFEAEKIDLRVLDDNKKAINLYLRCGFNRTEIIPLRKVEHDGEVNWVEDMTVENAEKRFIHMICTL